MVRRASTPLHLGVTKQVTAETPHQEHRRPFATLLAEGPGDTIPGVAH